MLKRLAIGYAISMWIVLAHAVMPGVAQNPARRATTSQSRVAAQIAAIEKYCKGIDRYIELGSKPVRFFADVSDGKTEKPRWQEFSSSRKRDEFAEESYQTADVWRRAGRTILVLHSFSSPSGDWMHAVNYYFRADGTLCRTSSTLRTFYTSDARPLRVVRNQFYDVRGKLLGTSAEYFDIRTGKKQKSVSYFKNDPPVYKRVSNLPFYDLLKKPKSKS